MKTLVGGGVSCGKDTMQEQGKGLKSSVEEGAAKTRHDELTTTPITKKRRIHT